MRCSTCGHDNPSTNTFCSKCASSLAKERATNLRSRTVYVPPSEEQPLARPPKRQSSSAGWWIIFLIIIGLIIWLLYGQASGL